jgi:dihydroorotase
MKLLIKDAFVYSPGSSYHLQIRDISIRDGIIEKIGTIKNDGTYEDIIEGEKLLVSPPWFDLMAFFCEPGEEFKETLKTGSDAAMFSGFGHVVVHGYPEAPIHNQSIVQKIKKYENTFVQLHPAGCLTEKYQGKNIPEMYDMLLHGSRFFSDGHQAIVDEGTLLRIVQYANHVGGMPCFYPDTPTLSTSGLMNEGAASVKLGMKGMPAMAEEIFIEKLIRILEYCNGKAHIACISTAESVNIIRKAKKRGIPLTCSVPVLNLIEKDEALHGFDTNLKVLPPLRTSKDINALKKGLEDGTIDAVISNHTPQDIESKNKEFDFAIEGHCTLPFFVPLMMNAIEWNFQILDKITTGPYNLSQTPMPVISNDQEALLSIFDTEREFILEKELNPSLSDNSHYFGKKMKGKCLGIVRKNKYKIHD